MWGDVAPGNENEVLLCCGGMASWEVVSVGGRKG
jgi:hypothetical protein